MKRIENNTLSGWLALALLAWLCTAGPALAQSDGERVYKSICVGCHQIGVLGAPKAGVATDWEPRLTKGLDQLVQNAITGVGKMPAKGGNPNLGAEEIQQAIRFMAGLPPEQDSVPVAVAAAAIAPALSDAELLALGEKVVTQVCQGCHKIGVLNAPKIGNATDWAPRLDKGMEQLVAAATKGVGNMPPKGGRSDLEAEEIRAAILFMSRSGDESPAAAVASAPEAPAPAPEAAAPPPTADKEAARALTVSVNTFNRLLQPRSARNLPPAEDGIHDPENDGTTALQAPRVAFEPLPKGTSGNYVDWVKALEEGLIAPRWDRNDPAKEPLLMDLNIVREVKGSMPNVVYPHKQHLQWLECSNCHPSIFIPKKGANQISMAEILLGQKCGVCHGKVAFPVSECRRCHSQKKEPLARKE